MSLRQDEHTGIWHADITVKGKRVQRSTFTTNKKEAQEYHDKLKAELWRVGAMGETPKHTWDEAVKLFLKVKAGKRSIEDDKDKLRWLQPKLSKKPLAEINSQMIATVLAMKADEGVAGSTVNRYMALIRTVLNVAHAHGLVDSVPSFKGKRRQEADEVIQYLTPEQADQLEQEIPQDIRPIYRFSLCTGLRQQNVINLTWQQVDTSRKCAWINPEQAKGKKAIPIPLNEQALEIIESQRGKDDVYVFGDYARFYPAGKAFKSALVRCNIYVKHTGETYKDGRPKLTSSFRWHDLRHTWATWHVMKGTPLHALQKLGGWKSYNMVLKYAHFSPDYLAQYAGNV